MLLQIQAYATIAQVVTIIGIATPIIIGAASYISKRWVEWQFTRREQTHQNQLDERLTRVEGDINFLNATGTHLYEKRFDIVHDLFKKLTILHDSMRDLTAPARIVYGDAGEEELNRQKKAAASFNEFRRTHQQNKIFLTKETNDEIDKLIKEFHEIFLTHQHNQRFPGTTEPGDWRKLSIRVATKVPPILNIIEEQLRKLLNVER